METPSHLPVPGERYRLRPFRLVPGSGVVCPHCGTGAPKERPDWIGVLDGRVVTVMPIDEETTCPRCRKNRPLDQGIVAIELEWGLYRVWQVPVYCLEPLEEGGTA